MIQDVDNNRHPEEEIEGRDDALRDYTIADNDGELDDEEVKAVRQDLCAARRAWVEYSRNRGSNRGLVTALTSRAFNEKNLLSGGSSPGGNGRC